jgi:hypothetical protein
VTLRRPKRIEAAIQIVLALFAVMNGYEFLNALGANSCVEAVTPRCYPWSAEGPVAGLWNYETKPNYLAATATGFLITMIALAAPFFTVAPKWGVVAMLAISVGGYRLVAWLLPMMLA